MENSITLSDSIWSQFGAGLDMLENVIKMCPDKHWSTSNFWYTSYHCLFWTDYFLTIEPSTFEPLKPFTFSEFNSENKIPETIYTKTELLNYLQHCRHKAYQLISNLNADNLNDRWINDYKNYSLLEILLYNLRHIQHHTAQLNFILRQAIDDAPRWMDRTGKI